MHSVQPTPDSKTLATINGTDNEPLFRRSMSRLITMFCVFTGRDASGGEKGADGKPPLQESVITSVSLDHYFLPACHSCPSKLNANAGSRSLKKYRNCLKCSF